MDLPNLDARCKRVAGRLNAALLTMALLVSGLLRPLSVSAAAGELELTAVLQLGATYVPDRWVPVRVELTNRTGRDIEGFVSMPAGDQDGPFIVRQPCRVPARGRVQLSLLGRLAGPDGGAAKPSAAPLARVDWYSSTGERLAVTDLHGAAASEVPVGGGGDGALHSEFMLVISDQRGDGHLQAATSGPLAAMASAWVDVTQAPRRRAAYDAFRFVVLSGVDPDALDLAQRQALLDHLLVGGVLICPAPDPTIESSWIGPHWPVQCIARRPATSAGNVILSPGALLTQALPGRGEPVAGDAHYVHAAFHPVGLGRIAFTSFSLGAIDPEGTPAPFWAQLLGPGAADVSWQSSRLAADHAQHLDAMVGVATAPWWVAAAVAAAYLGAAGAVHLTFTGARRPVGFAVIVAIALVGSATLAVVSIAGGRDAALGGARLATLDLAPSGGGLYQADLAFVGRDEPSLALLAGDASTTLHPVAADIARPPVVQLDPLAAPEAGARASVVERVWRTTRALPTDTRIHATGQFGPDGLTLAIDNLLGAIVRAPLLVWTPTGIAFPLDDLPPGASATVRPGARNDPGDFSHAVVTSESAKLRASILRSAATPSATFAIAQPADAPPVLAGWFDELAVPAAVRVSPHPAIRSAILVRVPVQLRPSPVGSRVRIDGGYVRLAPAEATMGIPYDAQRHQWIPTGTTGQWLVGFMPPAEVGRLRPARVTVTCDASAPQHTISLHGDQFSVAAGGDARAQAVNFMGRRIVDWTGPIGRQQITFDPTAHDTDGNGRVWLLLRVQPTSADVATVPPQWRLRTLEMSYDNAEIVEGGHAD
ncbi:MAG TPA: hypothetical protein VGR35_11380 [Tepidisphaeraceae bacterium]|nr:hypothetical protein [Tepidisphaeraceae bacterium]